MRHHLLVTCLVCLCVLPISAENWPAWRGPRHDGTSTAKNMPVTWSKTDQVAWRLALPGPGPSTPVVWGDRIFMTGGKGDNLILMAVDTAGRILWERSMGGGNYNARQGESNGAAPSPSTDGQHVWSFFGSGVLACHDVDGNEVWKLNLQEGYPKFSMYFGMSTSPLVDGDHLYLQMLHANAQFVVAFDKKTGKEVWKHERKTDAKQESLHSYATPVMYHHNGTRLLLTHGSDYLVAHDPANGHEIWRTGGLQKANYNPFYRFVTSPVAVEGLIIAPSAKNGPVLGINPSGAKGDITANEANFHWKTKDSTPDVPSPVVHHGLVYLCRENGVLICLDAKTGKQYYQERTHGGRYRGSPIYADGKLYLSCSDGTVVVVKAGKTFEILAQNTIDERIAASPAIAGDTLYLRTYDALYAIRK